VSTARKAGPSQGRPLTFAGFTALLNDLERLPLVEQARVIAGLADVFKGVAAFERGRVLAQAKAQGTTQADLASQLGVSRNAVDDAIRLYRKAVGELNDLEPPAR
jgi:hypothetical protein